MELQIRNLTKRYGEKTAVNHFNLTFSNGIYALLGQNGAGKTTLMRMICDLQKPTKGEICLDGVGISSMGERYRSLLGYLPQNFSCYGEFTAEEFLHYIAALKGLREGRARQKSRELLRAVGLESEAGKKIKTFSGGMKHRLGIAQAVLNDPEILILDEPTTGLDPKERIRFRTMLRSFAGDGIVLLSTHIIPDAEQTADHIVMMKNGELVYCGDRTGDLERLYLQYFGEGYCDEENLLI